MSTNPTMSNITNNGNNINITITNNNNNNTSSAAKEREPPDNKPKYIYSIGPEVLLPSVNQDQELQMENYKAWNNFQTMRANIWKEQKEKRKAEEARHKHYDSHGNAISLNELNHPGTSSSYHIVSKIKKKLYPEELCLSSNSIITFILNIFYTFSNIQYA